MVGWQVYLTRILVPGEEEDRTTYWKHIVSLRGGVGLKAVLFYVILKGDHN